MDDDGDVSGSSIDDGPAVIEETREEQSRRNVQMVKENGGSGVEWNEEYPVEEGIYLEILKDEREGYFRPPTPDLESMVCPMRKVFPECDYFHGISSNAAREDGKDIVYIDIESDDSMEQQEFEEDKVAQESGGSEIPLEEEMPLDIMEQVQDDRIREPTPELEEWDSSHESSRNFAKKENGKAQNCTDEGLMEQQELEEEKEAQPVLRTDEKQAPGDQGTSTLPPMKDEKQMEKVRKVMQEFEQIRKNRYSEEMKSAKRTDSIHCDCYRYGRDCSSSDTCSNMATSTECPRSCKAEGCRNQRIRRREYSDLELKYISEKVGYGVITLKRIRSGKFVIEYVGDVSKKGGKAEKTNTNDSRHRYLFDSDQHQIDATRRGNISRFINHHCVPNMECQKWSVPGTRDNLQRLVFFAVRDIEAGEELNFNYQFNNDDKQTRQECHCGSVNCNKFIGRLPAELVPEEIVTIGETLADDELQEELEKLRQMCNQDEKREFIGKLLSQFTIQNSRHVSSITKIANEMDDAGQRRQLLKKIFSLETREKTQEQYALQIFELMKKWIEVQDSSFENVKLVQKILSIFKDKKEMFKFCNDDRSFLSGWIESAAPKETNNKTKTPLEKVHTLAKELNLKWFFGTNKIPKKVKTTPNESNDPTTNLPANRNRSPSPSRSRSSSPSERSLSPFSTAAKQMKYNNQ